MMIASTTTTTTCSRCGTDKTYVQNNSEKWYHDKDTKERICKNCYSKKSRITNRNNIPTIDLTKVKPSEIKIDDNNNTSKGKWTPLNLEDNDNISSSTVVKTKTKEKNKIKLTKQQREFINERNAIPFIQKVGFKQYGNMYGCFCNICGVQLMLLELNIPNKDMIIRLCEDCLQHLNKFMKSLSTGGKVSNKLNELTNMRDYEEVKCLRMYGIGPQHTKLTRDKWFL